MGDPARGRSRSGTEEWRSRTKGSPKVHVFVPKIRYDQTVAEGGREEDRGTDLEHIGLEVGAHGGSSDTDNEGGERVEGSSVARRLRNSLAHLTPSLDSSRRGTSKPTSETARLEAHSDETGEPKHNGDTDVLHLLGGERVPRVGTEALHPSIGDPVEKDDGGFDHLRRDKVPNGGAVPCPTVLGEGPEETTESDQSVTPKDTALYNQTVRQQ